ncbi:hypothetical protein E2P81_ATG09683 [Venturia nashicola]|uniref:Symplekin/Pta1 N-terminal domain-containing protein n=1 Tax=Venturia nashicola TaxID=86259 RepID=A0A4Z1P0N1_9PEZI|nr:hypothetical protein E6O75_ATG09893 [Venturia nashicola]TLD26026.1 hypothetical protein E2P81_ATG09683 [Venturia nashicola]
MAAQISSLNQARALALVDPSMYSKVLPAVLPILSYTNNPNLSLELKSWGADFLAEIFSSPILSSDDKQAMVIQVLPVLREFLQLPGGVSTTPIDQIGTVKSAIQAAASVFPLVFRYTIRNPNDSQPWQNMAAIKSSILRRMDSELPGVRICCLKFVERVVQTQTPSQIADPRRPDQNEISLALVPADHPIIPYKNLEAEAHGLLDRALSILEDNQSDALLVTATLNGLGGLVRLRPTIASRIVNAIMNFNPFKLANSPMTSANKVMIKSMEKTVVVFLTNILKRNPQTPLAPRIEQHILRLQQVRKDIMEGSGLKRPAADEPTDGLDQNKRQRLGADIPQKVAPPPLPPGPVSYAQLFSLTQDPTALNTNVTVIPMPLAARSLVNLLKYQVDNNQLKHAVDTIRERILNLNASAPPPLSEASPLDDEDDDYEPDYQPEDAEQIKNRLQMDAPEETKLRPTSEAVGPYKLPQPPQLSLEQNQYLALANLDRMFDTLAQLLASQEPQDHTRGFQEPVVRSALDKHSYFRLIVRVAIRPVAGVEIADDYRSNEQLSTVGDHLRQRLLSFILLDWNKRIANAVTWFNEEWENEQTVWKIYTEKLGSVNGSGDVKPPEPPRHYKKWVLRFLEDLSAYLGGGKSDMRILVRFVSEIPHLDADIVNRVATLAQDPERTIIVGAALRYLIQYRPPAKELCLDALQTVWQLERTTEGPNAKLLKLMRPGFVQQSLQQKAEPVKEAE